MLGWDVWVFALASFFGALWFTLASGTDTVFMLDSLESLWLEDKHATKKFSHIKSYHSFFSIPLIALVGILYSINPLLLFGVWIIFDSIWLVAVSTLVNPSIHHHTVQKNIQTLSWSLFRKVLLLSIVPSMIYMLISWDWSYKSVFLESLWLPIIFIVLPSLISQWIRWLFSRYIQPLLISYDVKKIFVYEMVFYGIICCSVFVVTQPYVVITILAIMQWWYRSRRELRDVWMIQESQQSNLKATILSLSSQINSVTSILWLWLVPLIVGGRYAWGYLMMWIMIVCVTSVWFFVQLIVSKE